MFTDQDKADVIELAAEKLVAKLLEVVDVTELVVLPLDAVAVMTGLGSTQVRREMKTVPMGKRKLGVSIKVLLAWRAKIEAGKTVGNAKRKGRAA